MSFLTYANGRIQTDSSSQLGESDFGLGELGKRKKKKKGFFKKWKKIHFKMKSFAPHRLPITLIKKMIDKKKKGKKRRGGGGGGDQVTEEAAAAPSTPESVVPAGLQPPTTNPFETTSGPMSPVAAPMAPFYPSPMQPPIEYPTQPQFPQAYPSGGGGGGGYREQPYYDQGRDSMPQFIDTEEESEWQPPTPMYEGPSAYEADPGQRGFAIQSAQSSPFDTSENEFASGADPGDSFPDGSAMSGWLTTGGGSWEDSGMGGEYDSQIQELMFQAQILRGQGQESAARALENQAAQLQTMDRDAEETGTNWLILGGLALGAWLLFGK